MKRLPTDFQILSLIYNRYYKMFSDYSEQNQNRKHKNFVQIDIATIANDMGVDGDIIFGRLYYHLEPKYSYKKAGADVPFFLLGVDEEPHFVNFPYLASVLASLRDENKKYRITISVSIISLLISAIALLVSVKKSGVTFLDSPPRTSPGCLGPVSTSRTLNILFFGTENAKSRSL